MNKWQSIQALRGIAVLGVVLFHMLFIQEKYFNGYLLLPDIFMVGQTGVDLFFVISGFVMVTITRGRFALEGESLRFLWNRFARIYPTYWFYFLLTVGIFLIKPSWVNATQGHQANLLSSFLLLPSERLPIVMVGWTLIHELWFYVIFTLLLQLKEKFLLPALITWGAIIVIFNLLIPLTDVTPAMKIIFNPYSLEFIIGALVALFILVTSTPGLFLPVTLFIGGLLISVFYFNIFEVIKEQSLLRACLIGSFYGFVVLICTMLEKRKTLILPNIFRLIGDVSYTIYLSHALVLSAIGRLWIMMPASSYFLANCFTCSIMFIAVICYGWLGYRWIEQPMLRISHTIREKWFGVRVTQANIVRVSC